MKNFVILAGHLGIDPEIKELDRGNVMATFTLATNEVWNDSQGQRQERVEWHRIVVFGKQAEACGANLSKGSKVLIEGSIRTRSWEDDQGGTKYQTQVHANSVTFLASAPKAAERKPYNQRQDDRPGRSYGRQSKPAKAWG